jgi:metal-dependent amidase/aminoacylase/carboxypeptidase family protein
MDSTLYQKLIAIRRRIHQHPELGYQEYNTAAIIREELGRAANTV